MKNTLLILVSFISLNLYAQAPQIQWQKSLGGSNFDVAYSTQQTTDGGYIIAGFSSSKNGDVSGNHGTDDYWIVKLDNSGVIQWQKSLGGSGYDRAFSIQQTADGGYIVAGCSESKNGDVSGNHGSQDYWIVKLDHSGAIQWQKCLGGSGYDQALSIQQTADGGYVVAGLSESNNGDVSGNHGTDDYWIVKLDNSGVIQWQKSFGGSGSEKAFSIQQTADGGYIVAGLSNSSSGDVSVNLGNDDVWIVKLNSTGNIYWQKTLGGNFNDCAQSILQTSDGYIVAGYSESTNGHPVGNHGYRDYWIVKLLNDGSMWWQICLGGSGSEEAFSIQQTADGGYIVAGVSNSSSGDVSGNHGFNDYWIVKLDNSGVIQWQKSLGGSKDENASSIQKTADGGYIVAGCSFSTDGDVSGNHGLWDYWIVKLAPDNVGVNETNSLNYFSIYPNPAKNILTIKGVKPQTVLIITDIKGEVVLKTTAKTENEIIDIAKLPAGAYFINDQKFVKE